MNVGSAGQRDDGLVIEDPLAAALDPTQTRAAAAAYQRGRRALDASARARDRQASRLRGMFIGHGDDRSPGTLGVPAGSMAASSAPPRATALHAAAVSEQTLIVLRATYVRGGAYARLARVLADRRLVVLRGVPGSGRTATATHLLDQVCPGRVSRLTGDLDARSVGAAPLEPGRGYLLELDSADAPILDEARLHQLSALLGTRDCYCVLVVDTHPRFRGPLAGYAVDSPPADARTVLARHTAAATATESDQVRVRAAELLEEPAVTGSLDDAPALSEVAYRASRLVRVARGELSYAEFVREAADSVRQLAAGWFAGLHDLARGSGGEEALRSAAFRIALAVLDGLPYHLVAEAGEILAWELIITAWPYRIPGRPPFGLDPRSRLASCRARLVTAVVEVGDAEVPVDAAELADEAIGPAVLEHVWRNHHNLRRPLVRWLQDLGADPRAIVWVRAALCAGLLCALDFPYGFEELIGPWAASDVPRRRLFAAMALDSASADERVRPAVRHLLRAWARDGDEALRWTAAAALRHECGLREPEQALAELRLIGAAPSATPRLAQLASDSVATLLARGATQPALRCLAQWRDAAHPAQRTFAALTVARLAGRDVGATMPAATGAAAARPRWPLLLMLADAEPDLAAPIADLLRWALADDTARRATLAALGSWARAASTDRACLVALVGFLPSLAATPEVSALLHGLLDQLDQDWADPPAAEVSDQLRRVLADQAWRDGGAPDGVTGVVGHGWNGGRG